MLDLIREKLREGGIKPSDSRIILTVSGGVDSMVMASLFNLLETEILVAHCNFGLRATESDEDEYFIREFCDEMNLRLITRKFDTQEYAKEKGLSIQMAARELRYSWFEELRINQGFDFIATAHNLDDQIETYFINLSRGTGIRGLTGISFISGNLIRPLIFFSRKEILNYAVSHNIPWREDSSNASLKYSRNRIRHSIIPLFRDLNPSFEKTMEENMRKITMAQDIYLQFIQSKKERLLQSKNGFQTINIQTLLDEEFGEAILYEILSALNFTPAVIGDVWNSLKSGPGKKFFSDHYRIIRDREVLIIEASMEYETKKFYIEEDQKYIHDPLHLSFEKLPVQHYTIPTSSYIGSFDFDKLDFPLIIRKWHPGDYFYPLGMENPKKLSDFFIDQKFSIPKKEQTWLLCSGQDIVWIIGHRIDNRFKITDKTVNILKIRLTSFSSE